MVKLTQKEKETYMKTYKIETDWNRHTVLADSFEQAFALAQKINKEERKGLGKDDELPNILSVIEGDEINEVE